MSAVVKKDLSYGLKLFNTLTSRQKTVLSLSLVARLFLVGLDIIGLALLGLTATLATGGGIDPMSVSGKILALSSAFVSSSQTLLFATLSVAFFSFKSFTSIWLNQRVFDAISKIEINSATNLLRNFSRANLNQIEGIRNQELSFALLESLDYGYGKYIASVSIIFGELALIAAILIFLLTQNATFVFVLIAYLGLVAVYMNFRISRKGRHASKDLVASTISASESITDLASNFRQLKVLGKTSFFEERFSKARATFAASNAKIATLSVMPRYVTEIALMFGFAGILVFRTILGAGFVSETVLAIFVAGCFRIVASMLPLQGSLSVLKQVAETAKPYLEIEQKMSNVSIDRDRKPKNTTAGALGVSISDLRYGFDNPNDLLFNTFNLEISPGEFIAITGESGSGKSTLADLILGLRSAISGTVSITDRSGATYLASEVSGMAYVPQQAHIFEGTIRENVSLETSPISGAEEETWRALDESGLGEFVRSLPEKLNTNIGPKSRALSGGQAQRLSIARALYKQPQLLILDESTSALDLITQSEILKTLQKLRGELTIIVISHTSAVVEVADRQISL